jgi:hypothetical protein
MTLTAASDLQAGNRLEQHSISAALAALEQSPLSRKRAMLLALLIDARLDGRTGGDRLAHRAAMARACPALGLVLELCAMRENGARLVLEPVAVTAADSPSLSEADYMVSLYNGGTVQRVRLAWPEGRREDALAVLRAAVTFLER